MKKLVSSILVAALALGMSVTAFAATDMEISGDAAVTVSLGNVTPGTIGKTVTVTLPSTVNITTQGTTDDLDFVSGTAGRLDITTNPPTLDWKSGKSFTLTVDVDATATVGNSIGATLIFEDATALTTKKVTITVNGTVVAGVQTSTDGKINGVASGRMLGTTGGLITGMRTGNVSDTYGDITGSLGNIEFGPDSEIDIWLLSRDFTWENNTVPTNGNAKVTKSQLSNGKITVKKSVTKGSALIDSVDFDSDSTHGAYIKIKFVEWFVSVKEADVDFKVYLAYKGSKQSDSEVNIAGTMENDIEEADEGDDYVSSEDGTVIEAQAYIRNVEMYLGNGVSAHLNMFKDKKYYGIALNEADSSDDAILNKYPEIDNVIVLKTVNVKGSGNMITFDMDSSYYVYDSTGKYLGTSADKVPYSDKYYFATKKITISGSSTTDDDDDGDDVIPGDGDIGNPDGGGDAGVDNVNNNPGTGVNGFVNVAVIAGVLSLAAAGVASRKKRK